MSSKGGYSASWIVILLSYTSIVSGDTFPPAISLVSGNGKVNSSYYSLLKTSDFGLTCQADRPDGNTSIQWRKIDSPTLPAAWKYSRQGENASITILRSDLRKEPGAYKGSYECVVSNTAGTAVSTPIVLKVADVDAEHVSYKDERPEALSVQARQGSTAIMTCNSSSSMTFSPGRSSLSLNFMWSIANTSNPIGLGGVYMDLAVDTRYALDEYGTLYIREVRKTDACLLPRMYQCVISGDVTARLVGAYFLNVLDFEQRPTETKLIRRTPDVTVQAGSTLYLSCVFESPDNVYGEVYWDRSFTSSYGKGSLIRIKDVSVLHEGVWHCNCNNVRAAINVTVIQYPEIRGLADVYASVDEDVRFRCLSTTSSAFKWFRNNHDIERSIRFELETTAVSSSLIMREVTKADEGVIRCAATTYQNVTVSRNVRLIVTDKAKVDDVKAVHAGVRDVEGEPGSHYVTNDTTQILFTCNYSLDSRIAEASVTWRLEKFGGDIDELTHDDLFGLQAPAVRTNKEKQESTLAINYTPESAGQVLGSVGCTLVYKLLERTFNVSSGTYGRIHAAHVPSVPIVIIDSRFPYWIVIAVLVSTLLIAAVIVLIVRRTYRNRGEQYHVKKLEQKAGMDPHNALQIWRDFFRPDSEPSEGTSLRKDFEKDIGRESEMNYRPSLTTTRFTLGFQSSGMYEGRSDKS